MRVVLTFSSVLTLNEFPTSVMRFVGNVRNYFDALDATTNFKQTRKYFHYGRDNSYSYQTGENRCNVIEK